MELCCMGRIQEHCIEANRPNHRSLILPTAELNLSSLQPLKLRHTGCSAKLNECIAFQQQGQRPYWCPMSQGSLPGPRRSVPLRSHFAEYKFDSPTGQLDLLPSAVAGMDGQECMGSKCDAHCREPSTKGIIRLKRSSYFSINVSQYAPVP